MFVLSRSSCSSRSPFFENRARPLHAFLLLSPFRGPRSRPQTPTAIGAYGNWPEHAHVGVWLRWVVFFWCGRASEIRPATEMGNSGEFPFQAGHRPPTAPGDIAGSCLPLGDPFWPCSRAILVHSGGRFSFRYAARHSRAPGGPRSPGAVPNALVRAQGSGGGGAPTCVLRATCLCMLHDTTSRQARPPGNVTCRRNSI